MSRLIYSTCWHEFRKDEAMDDYKPGGTVTIDGVEYTIREVSVSATMDGDRLNIVTNVRTDPKAAEWVEFTIRPGDDVRARRKPLVPPSKRPPLKPPPDNPQHRA